MRVGVEAMARRRAAALIAAALVSATGPAARAEYGEGAAMAAPAMVPSPFKPTGPLAATCEVVALGREDVCLEYKKLLTAYDTMQLGKVRDDLAEARAAVDARVKKLLADTAGFITLIEQNGFKELEAEMRGFDLGPLEELAGTRQDLAAQLKDVRADAAAVAAAAKKGEASPTARATIKLAKDLIAFADSL